jgi:hypothetical protein
VALCLEEASVAAITDKRLAGDDSDAMPAVTITDWSVCPVSDTRHGNLARITGPRRHWAAMLKN